MAKVGLPLHGSERRSSAHGGGTAAEHNLRLLIGLTRDPEVANRDRATMLLSQQEVDTPEVRQALLLAAEDTDCDVRAEALEGLAERDKELARPLVERELAADACGYGAFQAALIIAHRRCSVDFETGLDASRKLGGTTWLERPSRPVRPGTRRVTECLLWVESGR